MMVNNIIIHVELDYILSYIECVIRVRARIRVTTIDRERARGTYIGCLSVDPLAAVTKRRRRGALCERAVRFLIILSAL